MDIERLKRKRQINVQEQNAVERHCIAEVARRFLQHSVDTQWVESALKGAGYDPHKGILIRTNTTPCGGNEESASAIWLTDDRRFIAIKATVRFGSLAFVELEDVADITASTETSARLRGKGKSFGCLSLEVLDERSNEGAALG